MYAPVGRKTSFLTKMQDVFCRASLLVDDTRLTKPASVITEVAPGAARRAHQTTSNGEPGELDTDSELKSMSDNRFSDELEDEPAGVVGNIVRVVKAGASKIPPTRQSYGSTTGRATPSRRKTP